MPLIISQLSCREIRQPQIKRIKRINLLPYVNTNKIQDQVRIKFLLLLRG